MPIIKRLEKMINESRLLTEGFGFDYSFPEDKNEAIYDFYALSLVNPDMIQDDDLKFSLEQAKKKNLAGMKKFMLEALRRAVTAEIVHFQPFWDEGKAEAYKEHSDYPVLFDKMRAEINPDFDDYSRSALPEYQDRYDLINSMKLTDSQLFRFAADLFDQGKGSWHSSYGGAAWKRIAEAGTKLVEAEKDPTVWIDHAIDLAHNTGSIFTKWPGVNVAKTTLDVKRDIHNLRTYTKLVSSQLEKALLHLTKSDIGKEEKNKIRQAKTGSPYRQKHGTMDDGEPRVRQQSMTHEELAQLAEDAVLALGIKNPTKEVIETMTGVMNSLTETDWSGKVSQEDFLYQKTKDWKKTYADTMKKIADAFGVDPNDPTNQARLIQAFGNGDDDMISLRKVGLNSFNANQQYSHTLKSLMSNKWKYTGREPLSALMSRIEVKDDDYRSLDDAYLQKWLMNQYKNNHKEFLAFKERFIPELEKISGKKLAPDQKEHINDMIAKAEGKGYSAETKKEPKLKFK